MAALLALAGSDVASVDGKGDSAMHHACRYSHERCTAVLLDHGAIVDQPGEHHATPLHVACAAPADVGAVCVELLLEAGADPMLQTSFDQSARDIALGEGNLGCAKRVLHFTSGKRAAPVQLRATERLAEILQKTESEAAEDLLQQRRLLIGSPASVRDAERDRERDRRRHRERPRWTEWDE